MSPTNRIYRTCGVLSCRSVQGSNDNKIYAFHGFPNDEENKKSWIRACMNPKITTKNEKYKKSFVCEKHFSNDCYPFKGTKIKRLKKGSKPTKYLPTLGKNVYIGNEIVGRVVNVESVVMEEPVTIEEPVAMEEPVVMEEEATIVQSKQFSPEFEGLESLDFKDNEKFITCDYTYFNDILPKDEDLFPLAATA